MKLYCLFFLKEYLGWLFGLHYPKEIIYLIMIHFKKIRVVCGVNHTIIKKGKTYVFGSNEAGRLGLGDFNDRQFPTEFVNLHVKKIICAHYHVVGASYHP